uniref:Glycosyltransferase n=1 Tax=Ignisphaera aggregans TaxID=334771 RepID=A0A7J3YUB0_9CREN
MTLKIAIITPEYPPYISGGIGSYNYELVRKLVEKGLEVIVITLSNQKDELRIFSSRCKCYYLKTPPLRPRYFYFQLHNRERIRKLLEREKIDIIQLNSESGILVKSFRELLKKVKLVLVFHGSPSPFNRLWDSLKHLDILDIAWVTSSAAYSVIEKFLGDDVLDYADVAVHVSKHSMYYNLLCNEKLRSLKNVVIYPGIDITHYTKHLNSLRNSSVTKGLRNFIFGARLMHYKGVIELLKAFSFASRENPFMILRMFGEGPLKHYVLKATNSSQPRRIVYYGKVSREVFLKKVAMSDILVHPSFYECAPMVIIEATLLGKPVVAHKAPWSEEFIESFNIGVTVDVSDIDKFSNTLLTVASEEWYKKMLSNLQRSREVLSSTFSSETMVNRYINLYYSIL